MTRCQGDLKPTITDCLAKLRWSAPCALCTCGTLEFDSFLPCAQLTVRPTHRPTVPTFSHCAGARQGDSWFTLCCHVVWFVGFCLAILAGIVYGMNTRRVSVAKQAGVAIGGVLALMSLYYFDWPGRTWTILVVGPQEWQLTTSYPRKRDWRLQRVASGLSKNLVLHVRCPVVASVLQRVQQQSLDVLQSSTASLLLPSPACAVHIVATVSAPNCNLTIAAFALQ